MLGANEIFCLDCGGNYTTLCAELCLSTQSCLTLQPHGLQPARLLCPWGFSRQEHWSGLPCSPGDLPNPGIEPRSPALQADSLPAELPGEPIQLHILVQRLTFVKFRFMHVTANGII